MNDIIYMAGKMTHQYSSVQLYCHTSFHVLHSSFEDYKFLSIPSCDTFIAACYFNETALINMVMCWMIMAS